MWIYVVWLFSFLFHVCWIISRLFGHLWINWPFRKPIRDSLVYSVGLLHFSGHFQLWDRPTAEYLHAHLSTPSLTSILLTHWRPGSHHTLLSKNRRGGRKEEIKMREKKNLTQGVKTWRGATKSARARRSWSLPASYGDKWRVKF